MKGVSSGHGLGSGPGSRRGLLWQADAGIIAAVDKAPPVKSQYILQPTDHRRMGAALEVQDRQLMPHGVAGEATA